LANASSRTDWRRGSASLAACSIAAAGRTPSGIRSAGRRHGAVVLRLLGQLGFARCCARPAHPQLGRRPRARACARPPSAGRRPYRMGRRRRGAHRDRCRHLERAQRVRAATGPAYRLTSVWLNGRTSSGGDCSTRTARTERSAGPSALSGSSVRYADPAGHIAYAGLPIGCRMTLRSKANASAHSSGIVVSEYSRVRSTLNGVWVPTLTTICSPSLITS
jgi:hypothetical protein